MSGLFEKTKAEFWIEQKAVNRIDSSFVCVGKRRDNKLIVNGKI